MAFVLRADRITCANAMPRLLRHTLLVLIALIASSGPAQAYIDPNAGGMLFQLLAPVLAALIGGWLFLRRWIADVARRLWRKLSGQDPK